MPRVRVRPDPLLEPGQDLRDGLARFHHHVGEQQPDQDAIALRDVPTHREPA